MQYSAKLVNKSLPHIWLESVRAAAQAPRIIFLGNRRSIAISAQVLTSFGQAIAFFGQDHGRVFWGEALEQADKGAGLRRA